ncbi:MAG: hypothetical protein Q9M37_02880 [Desulfonauticus sp.]|nr:hypothetical protein [Desulfonauticus sp.]
MKKRQLIISGIVILLLISYIGVKNYAKQKAEEKINREIAKMANVAHIDYKDVSVNLFSSDIHIYNVEVSPVNSNNKFTIKEISIYDFDDKSSPPTFLNLEVEGLSLPINQIKDPAMKKTLTDLGYKDKLSLNYSIKYHYDKDDKKLKLDKFKIGADELGDLKINFVLGNLDLDPNKVGALIFTYPQVILYKLKIKYEDDSLVERILKLQAKQQNKTVKQLKKEIEENIKKQIAATNNKIIKEALDEFIDFIDNPDEITISIKPDKPLPLGRLMRENNPFELIKLLNVKVDAD